jgi:acyl-coenzyme A thioesterase PaaI-like protein
MYQIAAKFFKNFIKPNTLFKHGFNFAPMYRRSTGRLYFVSEDLLEVKVKIPISWKNKNYVGTIFGGSMASATDPIYMIQLMNILGEKYVVWDKEATIKFKRPAKSSAYADFKFTPEEISQVRADVAEKNEIDLTKKVNITNKVGSTVFAELTKTIYVADKVFYKKKRSNREGN